MGVGTTWISCGGLFDVKQIKSIVAAMRMGAATAVIAIIGGVFMASMAWSAPSQPRDRAMQLAAEPATAPAPASETDEEDDKDVPTNQVDKYISVYESMQKDHNLTVEQATSKQGLTVAQFREIEGKIERDDTLRERVRKALRHEKDKDASD
jgi:hypothetical protein